jgi:hypothetical protein
MTRASARWQNQAGHAGSVLILDWFLLWQRSGGDPSRVQEARQEKKKIADPKIVIDAVEVAEEAGLR